MILIRMVFLVPLFLGIGVYSMERQLQVLQKPQESLLVEPRHAEIPQWAPSWSSVAQMGANATRYGTYLALPMLAGAYNDSSTESGPTAKNGHWIIQGVAIASGVVLLGCALVCRKVGEERRQGKRMCHARTVMDEEQMMEEQGSTRNQEKKTSNIFAEYPAFVEQYTTPDDNYSNPPTKKLLE